MQIAQQRHVLSLERRDRDPKSIQAELLDGRLRSRQLLQRIGVATVDRQERCVVVRDERLHMA